MSKKSKGLGILIGNLAISDSALEETADAFANLLIAAAKKQIEKKKKSTPTKKGTENERRNEF
jgi:hypothetical protein